MKQGNWMSVKVGQFGGIVLCGGKSSRMGQPKMSLPFGDELMLPRVVRILSEVVSPIVVVAAADVEPPALPADVIIARDEHEGLGPLAGLAAGLAAMPAGVEAAYASACDVPLLKPAFVRFLLDALGEKQMVIPREEKYYHPLAAVYKTELAGQVATMIDQRRLRPVFLIEECDSCTIDVETLRQVDPELDSLRNLNTPEDYEAALRDAGLKT
jgi:molybdopterin-guanine dinucleotide biosynthesis protein A